MRPATLSCEPAGNCPNTGSPVPSAISGGNPEGAPGGLDPKGRLRGTGKPCSDDTLRPKEGGGDAGKKADSSHPLPI